MYLFNVIIEKLAFNDNLDYYLNSLYFVIWLGVFFMVGRKSSCNDAGLDSGSWRCVMEHVR